MANKADPDPLERLQPGDVRGRAVRGGVATMAAQGIKFALQLGSAALLGRLLTPGDFGLVAMVTSVTGLLAVLRDAGLAAATVQKSEVTHEQVSTLFWLNIALGGLLSLLTLGAAPVLAWVYQEPRVGPVTLVLAGLFFLNAFAVQHQALLRRQMRFGELSAVEVIAMAAGIGAAVWMAMRGWQYWSLVGMTAVNTAASVGLVWSMQRWRPRRPGRALGVGSMVRFGGALTFNNLLNYLFRNVDNLLIGWRWGPDALGMYSKAYGLLMLPVQQVSAPISSVAVAALSRLQDDPDRLRRSFLGGFAIVASLILPIVFGTFIFAEEVIGVVLGGQWADSVELFRLLAPAALVGALSHPLGWLMWSMGRADRLFKIGVFWTGLSVAGFVVGLPFGARGVALGFSVATCIAAWPHAAYLLCGTAVRMRDVVGTLGRPGAATIGAAAAGWLFKQQGPVGWPLLPMLMTGLGIVGAVYLGLLLVVFRQWPVYRRLWQDLTMKR